MNFGNSERIEYFTFPYIQSEGLSRPLYNLNQPHYISRFRCVQVSPVAVRSYSTQSARVEQPDDHLAAPPLDRFHLCSRGSIIIVLNSLNLAENLRADAAHLAKVAPEDDATGSGAPRTAEHAVRRKPRLRRRRGVQPRILRKKR